LLLTGSLLWTAGPLAGCADPGGELDARAGREGPAADAGADGGGEDGGGTDGLAGADAGDAVAPGRDGPVGDGPPPDGMTSSGDDIPGGGVVIFTETFDDADFESRGWYDSSGGTLSTSEGAPGSQSSLECTFTAGSTGCAGGTPARHALPPSDTVYLSFWIKFSGNWVGSGRPYHPHMFHFINDLDDAYVGPAFTYLTTYTEVVGGRALLALQDGQNVDTACVLRNDDSFVGCDGDFDSYVFSEARSVCACNGIVGDLDGRDCFPVDAKRWYSSRSWGADDAFTLGGGPNDQTEWHFVEVYFAMNSVKDGVGVADGKIRWVQDGVTLISSDRVLMRTGARAELRFSQFAMLPYIGDGSPVEQTFWVDDLTVATARP
jgi:hypothetical protein